MKKLFSLKKMILLISVFSMIGLMTTSWQTSASAAPQIAYYAYISEPILDWDPSVEFSNGIIVLNNIYETLLRFDSKNNTMIPVLATEYSKSEDGLSWKFKIRQGVKFHDGEEVDAEAVKFSIERTRKIGKGAAYIWDAVKSIKVVDKYTVAFELKYPAPLDLIASCGYAAFIVSPKSVKAHGDDWLSKGNEAGSGPYKLKKFKMGDEVIMTAFKDYWKGWQENQFDIVVVKRIIETSSRRQLLEKGDADITLLLSPEDNEELKHDSRVKVSVNNSFQNLILFLNTTKKPLDNKLLRQALSYAFPYQKVVQYAAGGYATQSKGAIPKGLWGHGNNLKQYKFDMMKAKELLKQAGYADGGLKLKFTYNSGNESQKKTAELFKSELAKLNIELDIRGMPWESQWEMSKSNKIDNRQDIFSMYWWPDVTSPYSWLYSLYRTEKNAFFNLAYYSSKPFDKLIDQGNAISAIDRDRATELFIKAQQELIENAPSIFPYDLKKVWITNKSFKGFISNPSYPNVVFFYDTYREN
jgi:peptide/nickel transport system substrate-binding protein